MQEFLDRTIVRVWASRANSEHEGEGVGHVSIELIGSDNDNHYMSLFPIARDLTTLRAITHTIPNEFHTLEEDMLIEKRRPQVLLCFYSFNHDIMVEEFESIKKKIKGWSVVGNLLKMEEFWRTESCASLAYKILQVGDSRVLLPPIPEKSKQAAKGSSWFFKSPSYCSELTVEMLVTSPDAFAKTLKQMKLKELEKRPELRELTYEGETDLSVEAAGAWCSVM
jgi:hypothetical protein